MKNKLTSAIALVIFSVALVVTTLIPKLFMNEETPSNLKTGVAISTSIKNSKDATDEDGANNTSITVAAVTVDEAGKVVACKIDVVDATINFNNKGVITSDLTEKVLTKKEQGDDYGMAAEYNTANTIGKEWYEQVAAFEKYCVGKTADQILGISVNPETGKPEDEILAAGCTMHPGNFQYVVADAIKNASVTGASKNDKLGLALSTKLSDSKDAVESPKEGENGNGLAEVAVTIAATTVNSSGKVTSIVIDAVQAKVEFDAKGVMKTDITADILTKKELGYDYGMAAEWNTANTIGKEWFEQVAVFEKYCVNKNADEILGISVNAETGKPDDEILAAGCTMHPGNFQYVVAAAIANAQ